MTAQPWMPLYPRDYIADTTHLTRDEDGGYFLLLMAMWLRGGSLPDDDRQLAHMTKCQTKSEWKKLRAQLEIFFDISNGLWRQKRLAFEYEKSSRRSEAQSLGAQLANAKRSAERDAERTGKRVAKRSAEHTGKRVLRAPLSQPQPQSNLKLRINNPLPAPARGNGTDPDQTAPRRARVKVGRKDNKKLNGCAEADIEVKQPVPDMPERSSTFERIGTKRHSATMSRGKAALMQKVARWLPEDAVGEFWAAMMGPDAQGVLDRNAAAMRASGWEDRG